uniref:Uncharacterized protein n=1 Tax=Arion vulgaris TaxID=1028688 RepID=A0A0B7AT18_9EUPU
MYVDQWFEMFQVAQQNDVSNCSTKCFKLSNKMMMILLRDSQRFTQSLHKTVDHYY